MKWFKFYGQDWLTDLKIRELSLEDRLCYITLLCLASAADEGGLVRGVTEWSLISLTNIPSDPFHDYNPIEAAKGCLARFADLGMIKTDLPTSSNALLGVTYDVTVRNFSKRQEENMSNAEKQKKYRERQKRLKISINSDENVGNVTVTQGNGRYPRIEQNRTEDIVETSSTLSSEEVKPLTLDEYINAETEEDWIDDEKVYRRNGKVVSFKQLEKEFSKLQPPPLPRRTPRVESSFDFDSWLQVLADSSNKVEKIIAFVWKERGYRFDNYDQWRSRMGQDVTYAKKLVGYKSSQVQEVVDILNEEEKKLGYKWSMSTIAKRIANVVSV
jgi:hypothetical protein